MFHAKTGTIKGRNGKDLTETEVIKKRWQEYTEELNRKGLNELDNHNGVITHLRDRHPGVWSQGSISRNKASGGDGIPDELIKILKQDDAVKVLYSNASKFGKLSHQRKGKGQFSFQFQRRAVSKNVQTTIQLHSFHMLERLILKILPVRLQQNVNQELPDVQAGLRKGRGTRDQTANIH